METSGSGDNTTVEDGSGAEFSSSRGETFHIYVLSFAYGILVLLVVGHLVWRWQWRRKKLSHFQSHVPGDKSFKCKRIQQRLREDFAAIQALSPDPRLIHPNLPPQKFGGSKESRDVPTHWYRMKVFDAAADFVAGNLAVLRDGAQSSKTLSLPKFLALLQQQGIAVGSHPALVEQCTKLYSLARYEDGTFDKEQFEKFTNLIEQVQQLLSLVESRKSLPVAQSPHSSPSHSVGTGFHPLSFESQDSHELLIRSSVADTPVEAPEKQLLLPTPGDTTTTKSPKHSSSHRRQNKPPKLELSPLVDPERGEESLSSPLSERDVGVGILGSKSSIATIPETPV